MSPRRSSPRRSTCCSADSACTARGTGAPPGGPDRRGRPGTGRPGGPRALRRDACGRSARSLHFHKRLDGSSRGSALERFAIASHPRRIGVFSGIRRPCRASWSGRLARLPLWKWKAGRDRCRWVEISRSFAGPRCRWPRWDPSRSNVPTHLQVQSLGSKRQFIGFTGPVIVDESNLVGERDYYQVLFLDIHTLSYVLTDRSLGPDAAAKEFEVEHH